MEDEIAAIRARHEAAKQTIDDDRYYSSPGGRPPPFFPSRGGEQAHTDRAALLRTVDRLSAELAKERERRVEVEGAMINLNTAIDKMWNDTDGRVVSERHSLRITHAQRAAAATITKDTP